MAPTWTDILTAASTAFAAAAAGGAYLAARHSNATADTLARIESERRHLERTPQIDLDFAHQQLQTRLRLYLNGPDDLGRLDSVRVTVEDDDLDRHYPGGPSPEEIERTVWGPFRFAAGIDGIKDPTGRTTPEFPLVVGKGRLLFMERTPPAPGLTREKWHEQNAHNPIRLRITCRLGDEEWMLTRRIDNPPYLDHLPYEG